jgi:hypothetical protein
MDEDLREDDDAFLDQPHEDFAVVKEIYDSDKSHRQFAEELERALEESRSVIIIEPYQLGEETARWIRFGNFLHKAAVVSGAGCLLSPFLVHKFSWLYLPCGVMSVSCALFYTLSWATDPCCKYQIDHEGHALALVPSHRLGSCSPLVLVRKDDVHRKKLHGFVAFAAAVVCGWQLYCWLRS